MIGKAGLIPGLMIQRLRAVPHLSGLGLWIDPMERRVSMLDDYTPQDVLKLIEKLRDQGDEIERIASDIKAAVSGDDAAVEAGKRLSGPEEWAKIEAAHAKAKRSGKPFDAGLLNGAFAGWETKFIAAIVAVGQSYRALASAAAHFGFDSSPFAVSDRIAELTAAGHLKADRNDGSNGYISARRIWTEFLRDAPFPEDAALKLEADMKRRIEEAKQSPAIKNYAKEARSKKQRLGRASVDAGESRKRHGILAKYHKRKGVQQKVFCEQEGISLAYLQKCLAWGGMRKTRSANKIPSSTK
ncbi:MAG: hypothetical protein IT446_02450 [Phycisphaerales bacterium]|nr:hypothetical protein [Phycisphaerales bacterium]